MILISFGDDIVDAKVADGIKIRRKDEANGTAAIDPMSPAAGVTQAQTAAFAAVAQKGAPTGQNQMWPAPATPTAPNTTPAKPEVEDENDLPF